MSKASDRIRRLADIRGHLVTDPLDREAMTAADLLDEAENALADLMQWIDGWDPNFIYDEEWPGTSKRARAILAKLRGSA